MKRGLTLLLSIALVVGCDAAAPDGITFEDPHRTPIGGDAGARLDGSLCAHPELGCPCAGDPPIDCYLDPTLGGGGSMTCHAGTRYCRSGTWTACESITDYTIHTTGSELLTGPDPCNPCDPRCFGFRDTPTTGDLTPSDSSGAEYDPGRGGIRPVSTMPVSVPLIDSDGDGIPDVADDCVGAGAFRAADGSCYGDTFFYHTLPMGAPAVIDSAPIRIQIRTADIYFLMDTTGSMGGELTRLRTDLTSGTFLPGCSGGIIGAIRCTIPDAFFGVGFHDDYNYGGYGSPGDLVYRNTQDITGTLSLAQSAVNALVIHGGNDGPESQIPALWAIATGGGLGTYASARTTCPAGTFGYPCFRAGTIPIVIHITDAPYHNGPANAYPYCLGSTSGGTFTFPTPTAVTTTTQAERLGAPYDGGSNYDMGNITGLTRSYTGSTGGSAVNDYDFGCNSGARDAGFRFTLTSAQNTIITLEGSSYDTVLGVFPLGGSGWCNDDAVGLQSELTLSLAAGTYVVLVDGYGSSTGNYKLTVGPAPVPTCSASHIPPTFDQATAALVSAGVRVITVQTCGSWSNSYCLEGEDHAQALGNASGSLGSSGLPYVLRANADGSGLSSTIVTAVQDLANYSSMDISARASGDTQGFTQSIAAISWGPGTCASISGGTTFRACLPGTSVNFNVSFRNNAVPATAVAQVFTFFIEVVGNGTVVLARIPVRIVVPPNAPAFAPTATYWHDYDSTTRCLINERPDWGSLGWTADIPAGTNIRIDVRSTDTLASIATATPVATVNVTTTGTGTADISTLLRGVGGLSGLRYLRAFVTMSSSADLTRAPVLNALTVNYTCIPSE